MRKCPWEDPTPRQHLCPWFGCPWLRLKSSALLSSVSHRRGSTWLPEAVLTSDLLLAGFKVLILSLELGMFFLLALFQPGSVTARTEAAAG